MRLRLTLAVSVALLLILGATSTRLFGHRMPGNLVVVDNVDTSMDPLPGDLVGTTANLASSTATVETPLSDTDLVSRQLFSDYIDMAYKGQINPASVDALATTYANSIANLGISSQINATDLNIVPNSKANLEHYSSVLKSTYTKYESQISLMFITSPDTSLLNQALISFGTNVGKLYQSEAEALKTMPVPEIVLADHLALTNNYLRSAAGYRSITSAQTNPVSAMAGISMASKNIDEEAIILQNLRKTLSASGIILNIQ